MKFGADSRLLEKLRPGQGGVFSTADLRTALAEPHSAAFGRRVARLLEEQVLFRFTRGFYVAEEFDPLVLSQRIAPSSAISFETVLAAELVIGAQPRRRVVATKVGRTRSYAARGFEIEHVGLSPHLDFGCRAKGGVRFAFDIHSGIHLDKLDMDLVRGYLEILLDELWQAGVTEIYIDGSFLEDKDHRNHVDGYFESDWHDFVSRDLQARFTRESA